MNHSDVFSMNTGNLAYIGDSVYDLYIRKWVIESGVEKTDRANSIATGYVNARAQALAVKTMLDSLEQDEQDIVKRARNKKTGSKAKNAGITEYKWATGLEALIGYLYLCDRRERLEEIMRKSIEIIGEEYERKRENRNHE